MSAKLTATFCGDRPPHIRQNLAAMCPIQDPLSGTRTEEAGRGQDRNEREIEMRERDCEREGGRVQNTLLFKSNKIFISLILFS